MSTGAMLHVGKMFAMEGVRRGFMLSFSAAASVVGRLTKKCITKVEMEADPRDERWNAG